MANLPKELIDEILLYLPVKYLLRFKSVSKSFFSTISSEHLMNSYLKKSSEKRIRCNLICLRYSKPSQYNVRALNINGGSKIPDEEFLLEIEASQLVHSSFQASASCNGLILLLISDHILKVWNPFTREYKNLPPCPVNLVTFRNSSLGFGYDSSKDDYKVFVIKKIRKRSPYHHEVWIFGFKSGHWRRVQDFPLVMREVVQGGNNCFVDGALHFLCYESQSKTYKIVAFDVAKENFNEVSMPVYGIEGFPQPLQVIEGCLCLCWCSKVVDIYVRRKHGIHFIWSGLCSVPGFWLIKEIQVLGYSKDGDKILLLLDRQVYSSYDLVMKVIQQIEIMKADYQGSTMLSSIESLVPIINFPERTRKRKKVDYRE